MSICRWHRSGIYCNRPRKTACVCLYPPSQISPFPSRILFYSFSLCLSGRAWHVLCCFHGRLCVASVFVGLSCVRQSGLSTSMLISSFCVRVMMSPAPASCHAGRPADVDDRDDLHDRSPGEVRGAQHFQRNLLVLLPREPGHLQRHHRLFLASKGFPRARRALLLRVCCGCACSCCCCCCSCNRSIGEG